MPSLKKHTVYIDEDCPMCRNYAGALQKIGVLDEKGKESYQSVQNLPPAIDIQRAKNEMAMLDQSSGKIFYGIDSIIQILTYQFPFLNSLLKCGPIYLVLTKLYFLVSYNRRVIASAKKIEWEDPSAPDFHFGYRMVYIILFNISAFALAYFNTQLGFWNTNIFLQAFMGSIGLTLALYGIAFIFQSKKSIYYLGHLTTIVFVSQLVFCILNVITAKVFGKSMHFLFVVNFVLFVGIQFWMNRKRLPLVSLPNIFNVFLIIYWVLYYGFFAK